ncbi:glutathione S-transferase T3 isoform X4 [Brassica rapa]|uniref:glutathione S-transferase T3 isoform X4 n=1 Tax=Brassica campestris TaxID=3711 RepID=UPI00142E8075|nr:glutathione S-transferase T3 isoform X4 [Brassica rapa]
MATLPFAVALLDGTATALSISPRRHGDGSIICGSRRGKKTATFLSVPLLDQAKRRHLYRYVCTCDQIQRWIDQERCFRMIFSLCGLIKSETDCVCVALGVIKHHTGSSDRGPSIIHTGSQGTGASNFEGDSAPERRERRKWTPTDDVVLISSWLNTSKDPVVGNEQKSAGFWKRIAAYFAASPLVAGCEEREPSHCKQRWHRINDLVSKFSGSYGAATRQRTSGQNENDVLKLAHQIYYNNYKKKFMLEHAWKELRHDQKWCDLGTAKTEGSLKKRKCEVGADTSSSQATENMRPPGVKAAKSSGKKPVLNEKTLTDFKCMWTIKEKELATKKELSKMSLLESLIERKESLTESEETLKNKLITDLLSD